MSFSDFMADLDATIERELCDPYAVKPAGSEQETIVSAWVETPTAVPAGFNAPVAQSTIEVAAASHKLAKGDVFVRGRWVGETFVKEAVGWRVTGAPNRIEGGDWLVANVERFAPA